MNGMPEVGEEHKKLARLAGDWVGDETIHPSPWDAAGGTATGTMKATVELDGFFVMGEYKQSRGGKVTYTGRGVWGWDGARKCYTMHWFDSMGGGTGAPATGVWEGKTLTFTAESPMGRSRYVYDFDAPTNYRFTIQMEGEGGKWMPFLESKFRAA